MTCVWGDGLHYYPQVDLGFLDCLKFFLLDEKYFRVYFRCSFYRDLDPESISSDIKQPADDRKLSKNALSDVVSGLCYQGKACINATLTATQ